MDPSSSYKQYENGVTSGDGTDKLPRIVGN